MRVRINGAEVEIIGDTTCFVCKKEFTVGEKVAISDDATIVAHYDHIPKMPTMKFPPVTP